MPQSVFFFGGGVAEGTRDMQTARAVPRIISELRDRGFEFATLPVQ